MSVVHERLKWLWSRVRPHGKDASPRARASGGNEAAGTRLPQVAVVGFYSDAAERAALQGTFAAFAYPNKQLFLYGAEQEGELHAISNELGDIPVACIHPRYQYPPTYLGDLMDGCDDTSLDVIRTAGDAVQGGSAAPLSTDLNPDVYKSLVPAHVFRLLFSRSNRHIAEKNRGKRSRGVRVQRCATGPVEVNGALPNPLHKQNGLYWLVDYAYRMDRRCIEAYLTFKGIGHERLGDDHEAFLSSLTPLQYRHLLFFLNTNIAGERAVNYVADHVDLSRIRTAVDIGSGYGGLVKAFSHRGCEATGLEIMSSLMELAVVNLAGTEAKLLHGDFLADTLPNCSYDLVTMTDVIEHVADAEKAIDRTVEVLRDGGYAYVKIPNYRFIDHVREDSHTGLFGITLLRHDPAAAYLKAVRNMNYSVGDYYDYDFYIRAFEARGARLVRADNVATPADQATALLERCRLALTQWLTETTVDAEMKASIRAAVEDYLSQFEREAATDSSGTFARDYMTSHWNMFFQKRPTS